MNTKSLLNETLWHAFGSLLLVVFGSIVAAVSLTSLLIPYRIIDGGLVGIGVVVSELTNPLLFSPIFVVLNAPFVLLGYRNMGIQFVISMSAAVITFSLTSSFITSNDLIIHSLEAFEIVFIGGALLGLGVGIVLKSGGCIDGTEVLALLMQKARGIPVGQTILAFNIGLYTFAGIVFGDLQIAVRSMITFVIASSVMDMILAGFGSTRAVLIISVKNDLIRHHITHTLGLGTTAIKSFGGYSEMPMNITLVVAERSSISEIKNAALNIDSRAFVFVLPVFEFTNGRIFSPNRML